MTKPICILFGLLTCLALEAEKSFEGTYDMELTQDGKTMESTFWAKGGKVRMKVLDDSIPGEVIMLSESGKMLILLAPQHVYLETPLPKEGIKAAPDPGNNPDTTIKNTGETREILGYEAHQYVKESGNGKVVIWVTDEVGSMPFTRNPILKEIAESMKKVTDIACFFPLESTGYKDGTVAYTMKVTKLELKELSDDLFEPPPGFSKIPPAAKSKNSSSGK